MTLIGGEWRQTSTTFRAVTGFTCAKHQPLPRPPRYWYVYSDVGKPVPFVPLHDPFESE
jgi:hypothetical protein